MKMPEICQQIKYGNKLVAKNIYLIVDIWQVLLYYTYIQWGIAKR